MVEQYSIREPDAQDAGVGVAEVAVPVVQLGGKRSAQRLGDGGVFRPAELAQVNRLCRAR